MRQFFTLLLVLTGFSLAAQPYNNEWIKYDQPYYKFRIGKTGLFRITQPVLATAGLGNTPVENLQIWRNGEQVPFYPSVASGMLPSDGFIDFFGMKLDGKPDAAMYREPANQHNNKISLMGDTASYFITVGNSPNPNIIVNGVNNAASSAESIEPWLWYTYTNSYADKFNLGLAVSVPELVYESVYDKGEFRSSADVQPATPRAVNVGSLFPYTGSGAPQATFSYGAMGNAPNTRTLRALVNGAIVDETVMDYFTDLRKTVPINIALPNTTFPVRWENGSAIATDRYVVSFFDINYAREWNFNNQPYFEFTWPAKATPSLIEVSNFKVGGQVPVLVDLTNKIRYTAHTVSGKYRFELPASAVEIKYVMETTAAADYTTVPVLQRRDFVNYVADMPSANYLIITNPVLYNGTNGGNPIASYKQYRESTAGGSYKVLTAEVDELEDQFAFGIKRNPLAIRNYIEYARTHLQAPPKFVFLIGRGTVYLSYVPNSSRVEADKLNLVPTWGHPGSDNLLGAGFSGNPYSQVSIGRLSVVHPFELEDYLAKVIEYEAVQKNSPNTLAGREWMKNVVHVTGASQPSLGAQLCSYMGTYREIVADTLFGGKVSTFCKQSTNSVEQLTSDRLVELFREGISLLTYFGHSSSTTLEFNIDDPYSYSNQGKYPLFSVNGCNAGNFFTYTVNRLITNETLSEKFVLAKNRGAIGFVASTHLGIVTYLHKFLGGFYNEICYKDYGKSIGEINRDALRDLYNTAPDYYGRMHAQQITLHADPAIFMNGSPKPDYVMEESNIMVSPTFISVAESSFKLKVKMVNIGRAIPDTMTVEIRRQLPDNSFQTLYRDKLRGIMYADSLSFDVPIIATRDKGRNRIYVSLDVLNEADEMDETNNTAYREFFIYDEEARPAYPFDLSIINQQNAKFYATTANPFAQMREYALEVDTTMSFNSAIKVSRTISSSGGVMEFNPGISFLDSTVYYWRVATVPPPGDNNYQWNYSSFTFMAGPNTGFGQDHYFQHQESEYQNLNLDGDRKFRYSAKNHLIDIYTGTYPYGGGLDRDYAVFLDDEATMQSACLGNSIIFNVIDPKTFKPWKNVDENGQNLNLYGSANANTASCGSHRLYNFEFSYLDAAGRKLMMDFLDIIPNGMWVAARSVDATAPGCLPTTWRADTAIHGSGNSLWHKMRQHGFYQLDTMVVRTTWAGVFKKNDASFTPVWAVGKQGIFDKLIIKVKAPVVDSVAYLTSPVFGPAKEWQKVMWRGASLENPSKDKVDVEVLGINNTGTEVPLFTLDEGQKDFDIASVDPEEYPKLRLRLRNADSLNLTPYQLRYWNVLYTPVPEGAISPNLGYTNAKDTFDVGEVFTMAVPFKNFTQTKFEDSLLVKLNVIDRNNVTRTMPIGKYKDLAGSDTAMIRLSIDTKELSGNNTLYLDVNPDNDQPEQYHFNNFIFKDFYVRPDNTNPLLDVTFDGVRIINRDIVSAKPHIQIRLKDEAKYMLLNDTTIGSVQVKYPDGSVRDYYFDNDTLRFTPATSGANNTATIDFTPQFTSSNNSEGDEFELVVKAKDKSGNRSGTSEYRISFRVISKPMISNLLNYPNPFSTSTAFVFTLTGSEIPTNIKVQILTITGKIVREITKDELGPLHIGRNITEFKWNGTDQYGQKLANGVYLYRVVTTMNGQKMDKYKSEADNTDKYFNNGYGKMYLMR